jgi:predicted PurR-regulated permease PerM
MKQGPLMDSLPEERTHQHQRLLWLLVITLFIGFMYLISPILLPFVTGMAIAYILDPLADRLVARGISRTTATLVTSGTFFLCILMVLIGPLPMLVNQVISLAGELPHYLSTLRDSAEPYMAQLSSQLASDENTAFQNLSSGLSENLKGVISGVLAGLLQSGMAILNFLALLVITPLVTFYLLRDWDVIMEQLDALLPRRYAPVIREQLATIDRTLAAFVRGQTNVILVLIVFYAVALSLAGLKYALIVAVLSGVLIIIPYIGTFVSGVLAVGIAWFQTDSSGTQVAAVAVIFVVGQIMEGYILTPRLVGRSVGLNPLWIIFGMLAGGTIMGFVGMLLAVPLTAVCGVLIRFAVSRYRHSAMYHDGATVITPP